MIEKIDDVVKAKAQVVQGSLVIWNARLQALEKSGDIKGVLEHLISPAEAGFFDNCGCNSPCGAGLDPREMLVNPAIRTKAK